MTSEGGEYHKGNIYSIDTNGNDYRDLFDFDSVNGAFPGGSLTLSGNKLYGMVRYGGEYTYGRIFSIDTNGNRYKDLYDFHGGFHGAAPLGSLILLGKKLYGMTSEYGIYGNIFSIDTSGSEYNNMFEFNGSPGNGEFPYGSLSYAGGTLYGMTSRGGTFGDGNIFSIGTNGSNFEELLDFNGIDGAIPYGSLTISGGIMYGMASEGRENIFAIDTNGNGFKALFDFNTATGTEPYGSLILFGHTLYGMTYDGGTNNEGVVFKIDTGTRATSIKNIVNNESIHIFPNPNNGNFNLQFLKNRGQLSIAVYNILGEKVYSSLSTFNSQLSINLSNQPDGVYMYRVFSESGELLGEGKMIIQH